MHTTLALDIIKPGSFAETVAQVYQRKKDEASAILNLPIIFRGFLHKPKIPLFTKLRHASKMLAQHSGAATWIFLLFIVGWLPGLAASHLDADSSLNYFVPRFHGVVFCLALIGLTAAAMTSALQLPHRDPEVPARKMIGHLFAWLLFPFVALFLTAGPALVVQTRMLLGIGSKQN